MRDFQQTIVGFNSKTIVIAVAAFIPMLPAISFGNPVVTNFQIAFDAADFSMERLLTGSVYGNPAAV